MKTLTITPEQRAAVADLEREALAALKREVLGEPSPEPDTFCPGCGIAARGYCERCREAMQESARLNRP